MAVAHTAVAEDTVKFGSFVSTSGPGSPYGIDQDQAMKLAVKYINADGGILGRKVILDQQDTAFNKTQAQSVIRGFIGNDDVIAVVGPTSSGEAFAADPAAVAAGLPVLAPNNGAQGVPQIGPYVHRIGVPEELLLPAAAEYAAKALGLKTAAIMYAQNDAFATTGYEAFNESLEEVGVDVVQVVGYDSSSVDFKSQLLLIKEKNPDAVFVAALATDAALLLRQMRQNGIDVPIVGNVAFTAPTLVEAAGDAVEGLIVAATWDPADTSELNQRFIADYKTEYDREPTALSANAFNCVYILKEAIENSKEFTREGVQKGLLAMRGYSYLGVPVEFKKIDGGLRDAAAERPILYKYKDGKPVKLEQ
nr:ABC transporter substrate-binding protein [Marivibrio halodurans]